MNHIVIRYLAAVLLPFAFISKVAYAATAERVVALKIEFDRDRILADTPERAIVKVSLDARRLTHAENRLPVNLAFVIDRSGSMSGEKIARAKEAAITALNQLAADDLFSLIAYDSTVETLIPAQCVGDGRGIERAIRSIRVEGNTALFGGVSQGASEVRKHAEDQKYSSRIILLSDGLANVGPSSPDDLARLGTALRKEGVSVTTIGLGLGFNEDLMTRLAQRSDGNTYFVESSDDLPRIFAAELGDALNVVARRVVLSIDFPEGMQPRAVVGREGRVQAQHVEIELNQLYGGQEKFALVEVEVAPGKVGTERKAVRAQVTYHDAIQQQKVTAKAERSMHFTDDRQAVVSSANQKVQADYAANITALAKDRAVSLIDADQKDAAVRELRARSMELQTLAQTYQNADVMAAARESSAEADRVEAHGLDNAARKSYRTQSTQIKNQQTLSSSGDRRR